jgi:hypothetical protein
MDEAIRLNTAKCDRLSFGTLPVQAVPFQLHFQMMFVTKHVKVLARLGSRHVPSSGASPTQRLSAVKSLSATGLTWRCFVLLQLRHLVIGMEFNFRHHVETQPRQRSMVT